MTDNLFKKAAFITDLHFGRSGNNPIANQDNIDFLTWAIDRAKSWGAELMIMGGDWYDNRYQIHLQTNHYSMIGLELLNKAFKQNIFLLGNHDLYYKEKRSVASTAFAEYLPNIKVIYDPLTLDGVTFLPWLIGEEQKKVKHLKSRYVFGHLEMSGFMMNSQVVLPDNPSLITPDQFGSVDLVFTGHFHKRQQQDRIFYTGNIMPFNFSDANDEDRGLVLIEWGKEPILEKWPDQPTYIITKLSELLNNESILKSKTTAKVIVDLSVSHEDMQSVKDTLIKQYNLRKMEMMAIEVQETETEFKEETDFKDVDQLFIEGLMAVESTGLNNQKLIDIYRTLKV